MKKEFNEALAELVEFATVSGNKLTKEQIKLYFKDIIEDESKYEFIYNYLIGLKIDIEGVESTETSVEETEEYEVVGKTESEEAKNFYEMYVSEVKELNFKEENILDDIDKMKKGDGEARERLTEYYLPKVMEVAEDYSNSPMTKSDLVAEGNLALFEANLSYDGEVNVEVYEQYIAEKIKKSIEKAIFEELGLDKTSKYIADKLNALDRVTTEIAKEYGREATLEEISKKMSLSEDEVKELMKMSINALSVDEGKM